MYLSFRRYIRYRICNICRYEARRITITKKMKLQVSPPDDYFKKKKTKDEEDIKVLKDMANSMRNVTATLTSSTVSKLGMNQDFSSGLAEKLNPEIEAFLQILRGSLKRIPPTSRLTCLIELLPIMQKYERA